MASEEIQAQIQGEDRPSTAMCVPCTCRFPDILGLWSISVIIVIDAYDEERDTVKDNQ